MPQVWHPAFIWDALNQVAESMVLITPVKWGGTIRVAEILAETVMRLIKDPTFVHRTMLKLRRVAPNGVLDNMAWTPIAVIHVATMESVLAYMKHGV